MNVFKRVANVAAVKYLILWWRHEYSFGGYRRGYWGREVPQKLKQFADIVYRF